MATVHLQATEVEAVAVEAVREVAVFRHNHNAVDAELVEAAMEVAEVVEAAKQVVVQHLEVVSTLTTSDLCQLQTPTSQLSRTSW